MNPTSPASLSISCTLFLHRWFRILLCWVPVFLQSSAAGVRIVWARPGGEQFSWHSTSWTPLSTPPSAASVTRQATLISASSFFYPLTRWAVGTGSLLCGERGWSVRGLPVGELLSGRSTAWKLLSRLPASVSEPPPAARTWARSSSCSWGGERGSHRWVGMQFTKHLMFRFRYRDLF